MKNSKTSIVPFHVKAAYAAPAFALAVVGIPVYVYIPKFYTDVVGVPIITLGYLIMAVRLFDAVTDPLIGLFSDRTNTPYGRRRPYIAVGSLALALSLYFLFNPPHETFSFETMWFGVFIFALFLFWTVCAVPYESLGPEITFDYDERTTLFGMRDGALIAGTLVAATSPALVSGVFGIPATNEGERTKFFWISVIYGPLLVGLCWWCVLTIQERAHADSSSAPNLSPGISWIWRNRPFTILLLSYTVSAFGSNLPATLILYYVEYVLQSSKADLFLVLYFVAGVVFLPAWILLARRLGKKLTWIGSMLVNTGAFMGVFFLGPGDEKIYGVLVVLSGIGLGATLAIPSAMQADVIDYDELLSGRRREGQYIGIWSISKKLAAALGVGVALTALGSSGYEPKTPQPEAVQLTLRVLYALVPSICNFLSIAIAMAYPISAVKHEQIKSAIGRMKAGIEVEDPLYSKEKPPGLTRG
jgi:GPH family glycoside/pentoside/hexuronide:cation symporter